MKNIIVVEVRGGNVQQVHGDISNQVHILDWDKLDGGGCALCGNETIFEICPSCGVDWSKVSDVTGLYKQWGLV